VRLWGRQLENGMQYVAAMMNFDLLLRIFASRRKFQKIFVSIP